MLTKAPLLLELAAVRPDVGVVPNSCRNINDQAPRHGWFPPRPSRCSDVALPASRTARALNKMPAPTGAPSCPPSTTIFVLIFQYRGGSRLTLEAPSGGCNTATNGDRAGVMGIAFQEYLAANLGSS